MSQRILFLTEINSECETHTSQTDPDSVIGHLLKTKMIQEIIRRPLPALSESQKDFGKDYTRSGGWTMERMYESIKTAGGLSCLASCS
jgi:AAA+ ATPase superfamily predicted ATPase